MSGWWWVLVWVLLVGAAAVVLGRLAWGVVRSGTDVVREAGTASARMAELAAQVERLESRPPADPDVFSDPVALARERKRRLRRARAARTRARRRVPARPSP